MNLKILHAIKSEYDVAIRYAGIKEKRDFAYQLAKQSGVPVEVVEFALLGDRAYGETTIGANRNCLMLATLGEMVLSADDDTIGSPMISYSSEMPAEATSAGYPVHAELFEDRSEALASLAPMEEDPIGVHEEWLGKNPWHGLGPNDLLDSVKTGQVDAKLIESMSHESCEVVITLNGSVGDCGWDNPYSRLLHPNSGLAQMATDSLARFHRLSTTREVVQSSRRVSVTSRTHPLLSMTYAMNNSRPLPPFPPVGRAEEVAFGQMLQGSIEDSFAVYLPFVVPHFPDGKRAFSSGLLFPVGPGHWLSSLIGVFRSRFSLYDHGFLVRLSEFLRTLGSLSAQQFDDFVLEHSGRSVTNIIQNAEHVLSSNFMFTHLSSGLQSLIAKARHEGTLSADALYGGENGRLSIQHLLSRFGELLMHWSAIVQAAGDLQSQGKYLAPSM